MTNEELKKKIVEIIQSVDFYDGLLYRYCIDIATADKLADALIAAGIGDVGETKEKLKKINERILLGDIIACDLSAKCAEYKYRAEVAERALRNAAPRLKCRGGLGEGFCGVDKCDYYHCNNDEGCVKAHLQQAEKELAEEGKDERP